MEGEIFVQSPHTKTRRARITPDNQFKKKKLSVFELKVDEENSCFMMTRKQCFDSMTKIDLMSSYNYEEKNKYRVRQSLMPAIAVYYRYSSAKRIEGFAQYKPVRCLMSK